MNSNRKPIFIGVGIVAAVVVGWLAFGFFGIQAAFIDNEVSESADDLFTAAPTEVAEAEEAEPAAPEEEEPLEDEAVEDEAEEPAAAEAEVEETEEEEEAGPVEETEETEEVVEEEPEVFTAASGTFTGLSDYAVSGDAVVLSNGTEQRFLRFENFVADNGPDLKVYLRAENGEFVSLGNLSGNIGDQNYEIPADVDLEVFNSVEIWCERFSVGFGVATLG